VNIAPGVLEILSAGADKASTLQGVQSTHNPILAEARSEDQNASGVQIKAIKGTLSGSEPIYLLNSILLPILKRLLNP